MLIALLATVLLAADSPESQLPVSSSQVVKIQAGGHPEEISISMQVPDWYVIPIASCPDTQSCAAGVIFSQCGTYQFPSYAKYAHEAPDGSGPYVVGLNAVVFVVGCDIFADGFESGDTSAWSRP